MIVFDHVSKTYPNGYQALKDINLTIEQGEFVAIIGLSGAGKSTLIRTINRMHDITDGTLTVDGVNVMELKGARLRQFRRNIGMIFQSFNLVTRTTVIKNVLTSRVPEPAVLPGLCWELTPRRTSWRPWKPWIRWVFWIRPLSGRISSRAVSSSVLPWPAPWHRTPRSFWQMNRWPRWTR